MSKIFLLIAGMLVISSSLGGVKAFADSEEDYQKAVRNVFVSEVFYDTESFGFADKCTGGCGYDKWVELYNPNPEIAIKAADIKIKFSNKDLYAASNAEEIAPKSYLVIKNSRVKTGSIDLFNKNKPLPIATHGWLANLSNPKDSTNNYVQVQLSYQNEIIQQLKIPDVGVLEKQFNKNLDSSDNFQTERYSLEFCQKDTTPSFATQLYLNNENKKFYGTPGSGNYCGPAIASTIIPKQEPKTETQNTPIVEPKTETPIRDPVVNTPVEQSVPSTEQIPSKVPESQPVAAIPEVAPVLETPKEAVILPETVETKNPIPQFTNEIPEIKINSSSKVTLPNTGLVLNSEIQINPPVSSANTNIKPISVNQNQNRFEPNFSNNISTQIPNLPANNTEISFSKGDLNKISLNSSQNQKLKIIADSEFSLWLVNALALTEIIVRCIKESKKLRANLGFSTQF